MPSRALISKNVLFTLVIGARDGRVTKRQRCSVVHVFSCILMSASEEIHRLEFELETSKQNLRPDVAQIHHIIDETKAEPSPTNLVRQRSYLAKDVALAAGFATGYSSSARLNRSRSPDRC